MCAKPFKDCRILLTRRTVRIQLMFQLAQAMSLHLAAIAGAPHMAHFYIDRLVGVFYHRLLVFHLILLIPVSLQVKLKT
jgi:hypothetical protein